MLGTSFPTSFRGTKTNEIEGESHMATFFLKIKRKQNVKVMQIGDSHVRGNILPNTLERTLKQPIMASTERGLNAFTNKTSSTA